MNHNFFITFTFSFLSSRLLVHQVLTIDYLINPSGTQGPGTDSTADIDATCGAAAIAWCGCSGFRGNQSEVWLWAWTCLLWWLSPSKTSSSLWTVGPPLGKRELKVPHLSWGNIVPEKSRPFHDLPLYLTRWQPSIYAARVPWGHNSWGAEQGPDWARALPFCNLDKWCYYATLVKHWTDCLVLAMCRDGVMESTSDPADLPNKHTGASWSCLKHVWNAGPIY